MPTKPKRGGLGGLAGKAKKLLGRRQAGKETKRFAGMKKQADRMMKDLRDATKKMTVHQEPRSKMAASLRSLLDQPRKKVSKSPHKDKKKSKDAKYARVFKLPGRTKRPKGKT